MRTMFYVIQLLDGFSTTSDNVNGLLPTYMKESGLVPEQEPKEKSATTKM